LMRPELASDERFNTNPQRVKNRPALTAEIEAFFMQYDRTELAKLLDTGDIAYGRINYMEDVWQHPALKTKEVESQGKRATFVRRVCDPGTEVRVVPGLGEHSAAIRSEFAG